MVEGQSVEVHEGVKKEDKEYCAFESDFEGVVFGIEDHEVHEGIAEKEDEPVPDEGGLNVVEDVVRGAEGIRVVNGPGGFVVESIEQVSFGLVVAFLHRKVFYHFPCRTDNCVVFFADVRVARPVLFRGVHYNNAEHKNFLPYLATQLPLIIFIINRDYQPPHTCSFPNATARELRCFCRCRMSSIGRPINSAKALLQSSA